MLPGTIKRNKTNLKKFRNEEVSKIYSLKSQRLLDAKPILTDFNIKMFII